MQVEQLQTIASICYDEHTKEKTKMHIFRNVIHNRITFRHAKLSQMGELYISTMISSLAKSLIGIFVPVYLYQLGYSLDVIALFYLFIYGTRIVTDGIAGWLIGEFGPKHMMILSHMFLITQLYMLATLEQYEWSLLLIGALQIVSTGLFFMSYHTAFSKIHSDKHGGKQIGTMIRFVKLSSALGPLVGGIVATYIGVDAVLYVSIALILLSVTPLVLSPEPVRGRQHITTAGFPWKKVKYDLIANSGLAGDQMISLIVWPLFVSIFVFNSNVYLSVGMLTTVGLIMSVVVTKLFGSMIDSGKGGGLLRFTSAFQAIGHVARMFISTSAAATGMNMVSEPLSVGIRMPFSKAVYDAASSYEGYRIVYIGAILTSSNIVRTFVMALIYVVATYGNDKQALLSVFLFASLSLWLVHLHRFKALK